MTGKIFKRALSVISAFILIISVFAFNVSALGGKTSIRLSNSNPKVGTTLTVTVSFSLDEEANAISGELSYDSNMFKYISSTGLTSNPSSKGVVTFSTTGNSKVFSGSVDFEVLKEGTSYLSLSECLVSDGIDEKEITASSVKITVGTASKPQDTNKNTSAALTSITVAAGKLSPVFNKNVTEYTVVVPFEHTDGILSCTSLDPKAKISVDGKRQLDVGLNKRTIIVIASNGDTRRYTITFNRLDKNGEDTTVPSKEGVKITLNGKNYLISQGGSNVSIPAGFTIATADYKGSEIAVYKNATGKIMIVYLIAEDGSDENFYIFDGNDFKAFDYIECGSKIYIISEDTSPAPEGFYKTTYELNGKTVECFKYADTKYADFIILYGMTAEGINCYYRYDIKEDTMQRYSEFCDGISGAENAITNISSSTRISVVVLITVFILGVISVITLVIISIVNKRRALKKYANEYSINMSSDFPEKD